MIKLSEIKNNPNNPRILKDDKFKKLVKSIQEFPKMMELRPIVVDETNTVLGGNMRLKALKELNYKEIPDNWVKQAKDLTEEESKRFIIADNVGFGEWDWDVLANEWDSEQLEAWGLDVPDEKEKLEHGEIHFSEELDRVSNYVVLKFTNDIDFLNIQTILGLDSTYSKRANGKPWSKGMGRVVDGVDAIIKIKEN
jgi:ParB-like chromosome segregation protein Spo0J